MRVFKKAISLCLALILALSCGSVAFAAEAESNTCPLVYIPGIMSSDIYEDKNDPDSEVVIPDMQGVADALVDEIVPLILSYALNRDAQKLGVALAKLVNGMLDGWFNNPDGTAKGNMGVYCEYPDAEEIATYGKVTFLYDWRADPFVIAAELDAYINHVLKISGSEKVAIATHSLGSVVALTYLTVYGTDKVHGLVYDTPVIEGVSYIGELLSGTVNITGEAVSGILKSVLGITGYEEILSLLVDAINIANVTGVIAITVDDILEIAAPVLFKETLIPLFACWPTIWAMTPEESMDAAIQFVFEENGADGTYDELRAKVEKYNIDVRATRHDTLLTLDDTAKVAVLSRYGFSSMPISEKWVNISDLVVDTKTNSLGATTAPYGEYFDDEYLSGKDLAYISPDKTVDASTCLFPEKTWFFKDSMHNDTHMTSPLYTELLFGEEEFTCDTFTLSRFTVCDRENEEFVEDTSKPEKVEKKSPVKILFDFILALFRKLAELFSK